MRLRLGGFSDGRSQGGIIPIIIAMQQDSVWFMQLNIGNKLLYEQKGDKKMTPKEKITIKTNWSMTDDPKRWNMTNYSDRVTFAQVPLWTG